jgi:hypothetical protein
VSDGIYVEDADEMKFIWCGWEKNLRPETRFSLGHGLCVYDQKRKKRDRLIGFVEGYGWYHGTSDTVMIYTIEPDDITTADVLRQFKKLLEEALTVNSVPQGKLTSRIEIIANA